MLLMSHELMMVKKGKWPPQPLPFQLTQVHFYVRLGDMPTTGISGPEHAKSIIRNSSAAGMVMGSKKGDLPNREAS